MPRRLLLPLFFASLSILTPGCAGHYVPDPSFRRALKPIALEDHVPPDKLTATFLGNTTILISDGKTNLLVDGFLTRPSLLESAGKVEPDPVKIKTALDNARIGQVDAILVGHAHSDHALDAPTVARMYTPRATLMGSKSLEWIARGHYPDDKELVDNMIVVEHHRDSHRFGRFTVTFLESDHVAYGWLMSLLIDNEGDITSPVPLRAKVNDYKCGTPYAIHIAHPRGKILVQTSAGLSGENLHGYAADVTFLGIGLAGATHIDEQHRRDLYRETVKEPGSKLLVPAHWDSIFSPLEPPLPHQSPLVDNIGRTMKNLTEWAQEDGVKIWWPEAFDRVALP